MAGVRAAWQGGCARYGMAGGAGLSAVAGAQPMAASAERGDLALVPYYTVRGQWVTGIHVVNTSDKTQVVKFRFRPATDGLDALDFNIGPFFRATLCRPSGPA